MGRGTGRGERKRGGLSHDFGLFLNLVSGSIYLWISNSADFAPLFS